MSFWSLMVNSLYVFVGLALVFFVLPKVAARPKRRVGKPRPQQPKNPRPLKLSVSDSNS
jgi:hypothetical protein